MECQPRSKEGNLVAHELVEAAEELEPLEVLDPPLALELRQLLIVSYIIELLNTVLTYLESAPPETETSELYTWLPVLSLKAKVLRSANCVK